jgi:hypothetical protein
MKFLGSLYCRHRTQLVVPVPAKFATPLYGPVAGHDLLCMDCGAVLGRPRRRDCERLERKIGSKQHRQRLLRADYEEERVTDKGVRIIVGLWVCLMAGTAIVKIASAFGPL